LSLYRREVENPKLKRNLAVTDCTVLNGATVAFDLD